MIVIRMSPWHTTFRTILDMLKSDEMKGACDEIWLGVYGYYPLSEQAERAKYIKDVVKEIKKTSIRPVMEFGSNFGHSPEMAVTPVTKDFEKMVGLNGLAAPGAFCPRGKKFLAYQRKVAELFAQSDPWGMYLDDDLRIEFRNIVNVGCFCDNCIKEFNKKFGYDFTREEIGRRFVYDTKVRKDYVDFNRQAMQDYAYMMAKEMTKVNPDIRAGWENCFLGAYNGEDFRYVFDGLHEATGNPVMSRSGAFVYNDHDPRSMIDKVLTISYQNSILPDFVTVRRPEIENTCFFAQGKSIQGMCSEATFNMALGCNGVSFHAVGEGVEPIPVRKRMFEEFKKYRPFWVKIGELGKRGTLTGMFPAYFPDVYLATHKTKEDLEREASAAGKNLSDYAVPDSESFWWGNSPKERGRELFVTGMPLSYYKNRLKAYILHPDVVDRLSDEDIRDLLSSNVLTDGNTIMTLAARGYGDMLPFEAKPSSGLFYEVYTDDKINGDLCGTIGMTDAFVPVSFQLFTAKNRSCRVLSRRAVTFDYGNGNPCPEDSPVTSITGETSLGGKWAVIGTNMWCKLINYTKRLAILRLCDYLTGGLPAYILESEQIAVMPVTDDSGRFVGATLQSISIGDTEENTLLVRDPSGEKFILSRPGEEDIELPCERKGTDYLVKLPPLRGWHAELVTVK